MEPKDLNKPDQAVADSAAGQTAQPGRSYAGILVHHGAAPLNKDGVSENVYSITLKTAEGNLTFQDPALERAMSSTPTQLGAPLRLDHRQGTWNVQTIDAAALKAFNAEAGKQQTPGTAQSPVNTASQAAAEIDPGALDALMKVVGEMKAKGASLDPEEVRRINESLNEHKDVASAKEAQQPQHQPNGTESLLRGSAELVSGVASLTGAALQGIGKGAGALADALQGGAKTQDANTAPAPAVADELTGRVQVLPRLSEYRVDQVEKAASNYEKAHTAFWNAQNMPQVREQIEARAEQAGLTVPEVIEKMKPDGEFTDLHEAFVDAVGQSPDAQDQKKAMDKALTGWTRQYGRAQEELLNPETEGNPHYDKLKNRLETSSDSIHRNAADTPAFEGETQSHLERLQESMQRIFERLKEMVKGIVNLVRNRPGGGSQDNDMAP